MYAVHAWAVELSGASDLEPVLGEARSEEEAVEGRRHWPDTQGLSTQGGIFPLKAELEVSQLGQAGPRLAGKSIFHLGTPENAGF